MVDLHSLTTISPFLFSYGRKYGLPQTLATDTLLSGFYNGAYAIGYVFPILVKLIVYNCSMKF